MASRMHVLHRTYCIMAIENFEKYEFLKNNNSKAEENDYEENIFKCYISTIVFSYMALEAYTFDLLCLIFDDDLVNNHFESLAVIDRFALIVKSINMNNKINKDKIWYNYLYELNRTRNYFVHSKSFNFDPENIANHIDKINKQKNKNISIYNAIKLLFITDDYMDNLIKGKIEHLELILSNRFETFDFDTERSNLLKIKKALI